MSRDAKNSLFATAFVLVFFAVAYSTWDRDTGSVIWPVAVAVLFGLAKRYVLKYGSEGEKTDG